MTTCMIKAPPDFPYWADLIALLRSSFAYMTPILGHPPKVESIDAATLAQSSANGSAWVIMDTDKPVACLFTRPSRDMKDALYCGWLAVSDTHRGQGLARILFDAAEKEARNHAYDALTLDTGRPLTDLHRLFAYLGFSQLPGSGPVISFRKPLAYRLSPSDDRIPGVFDLLQRSFAYMKGRIDPPSSLEKMDAESFRRTAVNKELWAISINRQPVACMLLTPQPDTLYLGKLATDPDHRRYGLARCLLNHAQERARDLILPSVTLQTRVELVENHAMFRAMGFNKTGETAHTGFDRPTSFEFVKTL